jgi:hypothetical protein
MKRQPAPKSHIQLSQTISPSGTIISGSPKTYWVHPSIFRYRSILSQGKERKGCIHKSIIQAMLNSDGFVVCERTATALSLK